MSFPAGEYRFFVDHLSSMQVSTDVGDHVVFQVGGGQFSLAIAEPDPSIKESKFFIDQVTEMAGINIGRV